MGFFDNMYPTKFEVPGNVKCFQDDVYGIGALCRAVRELLEGKVKTVVFKTGKMDEHKGWVEVSGFILETKIIEGVLTFIEGNSSVVASWYGTDASDPARIVGTLIANFGTKLFRQKV